MTLEYSVGYRAENSYETEVREAIWQFLILPEENETQELVKWQFTNSQSTPYQLSSNGFGFTTLRLHPRKRFTHISFEATCRLLKRVPEPRPAASLSLSEERAALQQLSFRVAHEPFLRSTPFTHLPAGYQDFFHFEAEQNLLTNLHRLNEQIHQQLGYQTGVTHVRTQLTDVLDQRQGVCQDFSHLFCAISRANGIPCRYVSGYLHQGHGFVGDLQMHAWVEAYLPGQGWLGFDPTNNVDVKQDHIKVAHGKDYHDCPPIKGVVFNTGDNQTQYSVSVLTTEQ